MLDTYDKIIIGGGFYGLYAAYYCGKKSERVLLLEQDSEPFMRASYINQARVHMGYHYPRSISTATKSKDYFDRFNRDFDFCVNREFEQIYAISSNFSWTNAAQFTKFCEDSGIYYSPIHEEKYFKKDMCDVALLTKEYAYDAIVLRDWLTSEMDKMSNVTLLFGTEVKSIEKDDVQYVISSNNSRYKSRFILNSTYASLNQIHKMAGFEPFKIKYELCEIILCEVSDNLKGVGLTVMDGAFFSIMPFGKTGFHSLTSVSFTPHQTSCNECPAFGCQNFNKTKCSPSALDNCNSCPGKPSTAYSYMSQLARKYIRDEFKFRYVDSLFSMKAVLKTSEIDDGRPTVIRQMNKTPKFYSILSGKINSVYDLEGILDEE